MADASIPESMLLDVSAALGMQRRQRRVTRLRMVSAFRRGWTLILVALLDHEPLPIATFLPEPWSTVSLSIVQVFAWPEYTAHWEQALLMEKLGISRQRQ